MVRDVFAVSWSLLSIRTKPFFLQLAKAWHCAATDADQFFSVYFSRVVQKDFKRLGLFWSTGLYLYEDILDRTCGTLLQSNKRIPALFFLLRTTGGTTAEIASPHPQ